jgi:ribose-phosphate pyrophosphokinase
MKITKYPDGSSYVDAAGLDYSRVFRINTYEDLWHLHQFIDAYHSVVYDPLGPRIIIPWLIDGQADDRFQVGQSFGLKLVCDFLNQMNAHFTIFHPHNPGMVKALIKNVSIMDNTEFIRKCLYYIRDRNKERSMYENIILLSPDAGAYKPLISLAKQIHWQGEIESASKSRNKKDFSLTQFVGRQDFQGKDVMIIDDICVHGGTFKGLSKILKERNCGKLYLAVSHITVQDLTLDPVVDYFNAVFTTNSKFSHYHMNGDQSLLNTHNRNLKVFNLFDV